VDVGGAVHALQPLEASNSLIHVFTHPALWRRALWLPYRRDPAELHAALHAAAAAAEPPRAVFAHVDVLGAQVHNMPRITQCSP
jgi:hypothetical protein